MTEIKLHDIRQPVPKGWKLAQTLEAMHHNRHAVLIQRMAHSWTQKTDRRVGLSSKRLMAAMPVGWHTARAVAKMLECARASASVLLLRALRADLVERRPSACPHCGERMFEWRRK